MQRNVASPAEYLASVPAHQRPLIEHLRHLILEVAPGIREQIRWGMLCYEDTGVLFSLAAQKQYVSLYAPVQALTDLEDQLQGLNHGKCCLRFRKIDAIPTSTIRKLLIHAQNLHVRGCCDE